MDWTLSRRSDGIILLVVDDADTAEAAALREKAARSLRAGLDGHLEHEWGSCGSADPAEWHSMNLRVVVVRPSAPDGESLLTPLDEPSLAWISHTATPAEADALTESVTTALGQRLAAPGEAYRPLRAAKRALDLVTFSRPPVGEAESALVASLPTDALVQILIAGTRDDEDETDVSELTPGEASLETMTTRAVAGPFGASENACLVSALGSTRLEAWADRVSAQVVESTCEDEQIWGLLLHPGWADCGSVCMSKPIAVAEDGQAGCQITIDQPDHEGCDASRGWFDPEGEPAFVERNGTRLRRCEIAQLSGDDLERCQQSLGCPECASGFCVTEVPEILSREVCSEAEHLWPLRFIGGARNGLDGYINITCDTAEAHSAASGSSSLSMPCSRSKSPRRRR
ncbi:hypothetical protein ACMHYB_01160 [Sorangium sp. So ce1128]